MKDLSGFCDTVFKHAGYCELKRDRKLILEVLKDGEMIVQPLTIVMVNDTLKRVDAKLAEFSDEEKQIYDAVYGENAA